ncbi:MAG TPA: ATPase, partial [Acholeplasma sp.]|nr:ATPase [Acholeplasma sp.]
MKKLYQMSCEEIEKLTETNLKTGLTNSEILIRQEKGKNELEVAKKVPFIVKFLNQFKDFMIVVLICAALISILAAREYANGLLIIMIVVVNALIGAGQEEKAEKSLDAIKDLSSPHITVLRDGV